MTMRWMVMAGALLGTMIVPAACMADTVTYSSVLSSAGEVPPTSSAGMGTALYSLTGDMLTVNLTFSGLTSNLVAGHIHCCAPMGMNAPIVLPFTGLPSAMSGTYMHTYNLTTALVGISEGTFLTALDSGLAYTNLHTVMYPGGEIRGQVAVGSPVPEPGSLLLLGTGAMGLIGVVRRRLRG